MLLYDKKDLNVVNIQILCVIIIRRRIILIILTLIFIEFLKHIAIKGGDTLDYLDI